MLCWAQAALTQPLPHHSLETTPTYNCQKTIINICTRYMSISKVQHIIMKLHHCLCHISI